MLRCDSVRNEGNMSSDFKLPLRKKWKEVFWIFFKRLQHTSLVVWYECGLTLMCAICLYVWYWVHFKGSRLTPVRGEHGDHTTRRWMSTYFTVNHSPHDSNSSLFSYMLFFILFIFTEDDEKILHPCIYPSTPSIILHKLIFIWFYLKLLLCSYWPD